jgi:ABC-type transport system involved in multi-copper enzyme maturation permease subunit
MSLFALAALMVGVIGVRTADEAHFLMSFGLTLAYLLAGLVTILLASRQFPREFENKTLYPLLARPLSRMTFLAGKIGGVGVLGALTLLLLSGLAWLPTPKADHQQLATLLQVVGLQTLSLLLLATVTAAVSLFAPSVVAMLVSTALFMFGGPVLQGLRFGLTSGETLVARAFERLLSLVPDFSLFEHIARFVEGEPPIEPMAAMAVLAYGLWLGALYFTLAAWTLGRRQL